MKKYITTILVGVMFTAGLSLLLYPFAANQWNNYRQSQLLTTYEDAVAEMEESGRVDYEEEWRKARNYNDELLPYILPDSFSTAELPQEGDAAYLSCLNLTQDGMMGYVEVPKINVKLPVYHTTNEDVLQKAAGHLPGSSLPIGGEGSHAVISAHRGLPSASLFTDLDKLKEGDIFLLSVLNETLAYQVDRVSVVEPTDTQDLAAEDGEDLVTLLTCTPYGVNSQRLLVRGHRVPYEEAADEGTPLSAFSGLVGPSMHTSYLLWVLIGLAVTGTFIFLLYRNDRKWKRMQAPQGEISAGRGKSS